MFLETLYGEKQVSFVSSLDCVKLTGLPYSATADDVVNFFNELADDIKTSGIHMVLNTQVCVIATSNYFINLSALCVAWGVKIVSRLFYFTCHFLIYVDAIMSLFYLQHTKIISVINA